MIPKTIVVPLDGSELAQRALTVATPLAHRLGAGVLLMTTPWDNDPRVAQSYLDAVAGLAVDVPVATEIVDLPASEAIAHVAGAGGDRTVCMTTHGRGRLRWAVAGSVAEAVIRESTRPLLLVGPHGVPTWSDPPGQVVVCADGSPAAEGAARAGAEWAKALGCELTFAYVGHPLDVEDAMHPDQVFGPLEDIGRSSGTPVHTRYSRSSFVAGSLLDIAEEPPATLLVMAAHARVGFARVALGSVTMGVLNTATCPVLVTPPHAEPS